MNDLKRFVRQSFDRFNEDPQAFFVECVQDRSLIEKIRVLLAAFPNHKVSTEDMVAEGNKIAVRGRLLGVHAGELMGLPPTQRQVEVPFFAIYCVEHGKIVQHWAQVDTVRLLQQIRGGALASLVSTSAAIAT